MNKTTLGLKAGLGFLSLFLAVGCASTGANKGSIDEQPQTKQKSTMEKPKVMDEKPKSKTTSKKSVVSDKTRYVVNSGDTLWDISASDRGYSDPFTWPAIYRANRDLIEDPHLIYPEDEITIPLGLSSSERARMESLARQSPAYSPQTSPRARELLDYLLE